MSDIIKTEEEIQPSQLDLAAKVSGRAEIKGLFLLEGHQSRSHEVDTTEDGNEFVNAYRVDCGLNTEDSLVYVKVSFTCKLVRPNDEGAEPKIKIEATFVIIYSLNSLDGIEQRHVQAFGSLNGVYNAWPYWREYVQSSCGRMGLAPITIPAFRFS